MRNVIKQTIKERIESYDRERRRIFKKLENRDFGEKVTNRLLEKERKFSIKIEVLQEVLQEIS